VHYSWHFKLPAAAELDLHWYIFDQCCYPHADADSWESSVPVKIEGFPAQTLSPTDQMLHICVHGAEWGPVPPLRWIADAMTILACAAGQIDWQRLVRQTKERRLVPAVRDTLTYLQTRLSAPVPNAVLSDLRSVPVSLTERVEYRSRTSPPGNFPSLRKICFGYLRYRSRTTVHGFRRLVAFPRYLQARWGASNLWQLPGIGFGWIHEMPQLMGRAMSLLENDKEEIPRVAPKQIKHAQRFLMSAFQQALHKCLELRRGQFLYRAQVLRPAVSCVVTEPSQKFAPDRGRTAVGRVIATMHKPIGDLQPIQGFR